MLTIWGDESRFCDGVARRGFLRAGFLGLGGIGLADLLRVRAQAERQGQSSRRTSVIYVELAGGPTQFETYDPKPDAPIEYRGSFDVAQTNVPGVIFSELMPEQAKLMDRLSIIRSVRHNHNSHDPSSHLTQTGYYKRGPKGGPNQMPCFGSIVAKVRGPNAPALPAYVAIPRIMRNGGPSHLGKGYTPFETRGDPNRPNFKVRNLALTQGLNMARLDDRRELLSALDARQRLTDLEGSSDAIDQFTRQAFDMTTGPLAREAFDINREDPRLRDAYGRNNVGQSLLLARRLVEMGVTCVTVRVTGWDDHVKIAPRLKDRGPRYDRGMAALVRDLYDRGMNEDVLVVAMGEFGRTPRINRNAGRDHWGALMSALLAGGRLTPGIVGQSNSKGEVPVKDPYRPENVLAMVYRHLGIDPERTFNDFSGRPRYILERHGLIKELV